MSSFWLASWLALQLSGLTGLKAFGLLGSCFACKMNFGMKSWLASRLMNLVCIVAFNLVNKRHWLASFLVAVCIM